MIESVCMPTQLPYVAEPIVSRLYKSYGDTVDIGEALFSYESDGALFEEFSAVRGRVIATLYVSGDSVSGGVPIMIIEF